MSEVQAKALKILSELHSVVDKIDPAQIAGLIAAIQRAPRVFVIGVGREGLAARGFAMRLMHLGYVVHWGWDDTTPNVTKDDLFIQINGSGDIGHLSYIFSQVQLTGATTAVITGVPTTPVSQEASVLVTIPAAVYRGEGDLVASIQPMGSLFEQSAQLIFDAVVLQLMENNGLSAHQLAARHRNFE